MAARTRSNVTPKYKTKYRVRSWAVYEDSLRRRGDITIWFDEASEVSLFRRPANRGADRREPLEPDDLPRDARIGCNPRLTVESPPLGDHFEADSGSIRVMHQRRDIAPIRDAAAFHSLLELAYSGSEPGSAMLTT
jgi:hypothetical protein